MNTNQRWRTLWQAIGATSDHAPIYQNLLDAYGEKQRAYHTLKHIQDCLTQLDRTHHTNIIETAIWFHDAVYDPQAHDNEEQSAAWAVRTLQEGNVAPHIIRAVERLILITKHQQPPTHPDECLLLDIDLSILGQSPATFDHYETLIRQEYAWVPETAYRAGRAKILNAFLNRAALYHTPFFQPYEIQARENLTRSINKLV